VKNLKNLSVKREVYYQKLKELIIVGLMKKLGRLFHLIRRDVMRFQIRFETYMRKLLLAMLMSSLKKWSRLL